MSAPDYELHEPSDPSEPSPWGGEVEFPLRNFHRECCEHSKPHVVCAMESGDPPMRGILELLRKHKVLMVQFWMFGGARRSGLIIPTTESPPRIFQRDSNPPGFCMRCLLPGFVHVVCSLPVSCMLCLFAEVIVCVMFRDV